jgi:hypothetical protein
MLRLLTPTEADRFPFNNFMVAHGMLYTRRERNKTIGEAGKRGRNMSYIVSRRLGVGVAVFASLLFVRVALGQSALLPPASPNI